MRNFLINTLLAICFCLMLTTVNAQAATWTVTKLEDTNDGVCNSDCSLREAIAVAASGDTVLIPTSAPRTILLTGGSTPGERTLVVNKSLTITASGTNLLTIEVEKISLLPAFNAVYAPRVFNIVGAGITVNLNNLTLTGAESFAGGLPSAQYNGGAINANSGATVNINNCRLMNNVAALGGGLYVDTGTTVNLNGSTISGNRANAQSPTGAGIHNEGTLNITDSTISGNRNDASGNGYNGGGIFNVGAITMTRSTVSGNINFATASNTGNNGGGIFNQGGLTITNSTISGNTNIVNSGISNSDNGGGIWTNGNTAITNSTIADNTISLNGTNSAGGVYSSGDNGTATVRNTIIAANRNNSVVPDTIGALVSQGYNFIGNRGAASGFNQVGDQTGTAGARLDPRLAPLGNYGGATPTHSLKLDSSAIDKGNSFGHSTDQRGRPRPIDQPSVSNATDGADIGAFESSLSLKVTKIADTADGVCDADCSLREAIAAAQPGDTIVFASPLFDSPQIIALAQSLGSLVINKGLTINGNGANLLTVRPQTNTFRIFNINGAGAAVNLNDLTIKDGYGGLGFGGGGINANSGVTVNITGCHITNNTAGFGGGIFVSNDSTVNLTASTISNNTATIDQSTGGGIHNLGKLNVVNSTITGNVKNFCCSNAGGIWTNDDVTVSNSTITDNGVSGTGGAGGILLAGDAGRVTVRNSIIAGNRSNATYPDTRGVAGGFESEGYNLIGVPHSFTAFQRPGDQVGNTTFPLDPRLAPLGSNNGTTPTHGFLSNSPAIDKGNSFGYTTDQRNRPRPYDNPNFPNATGGDGSDIGAFESRALEQNQPPTANPDSYSTGRNTTLTVNTPGVLVNDTNPDGDLLTAIKVSDPAHGTLELNAYGSFTYTPTAGYFGTDSFTYKANDGTADSNVATVTLTINNTAPVAVADSYTATRNATLTVSAPGVLINDTDANNDALTAIKVSDPAHGALELNANGGFAYTPHLNYTGSDSFTYKAKDGLADSNIVTVTITVAGGNSMSLTVTKTADTNDGVCNADCSLREAIAVAQWNDAIVFASPLFDTPQNITLSQNLRDLVINKSLIINGKGANLLTIRPQTTGHRIFNINGSNVTAVLKNLTVSGASSTANGGGINANGGVTLEITGCHITGNSAVLGGGIFITADSFVSLTNSTVSNNTANDTVPGGGGIQNEGNLLIENSTVSGNRKDNGFNNGGGIWSSGVLNLYNSTVTNNITVGANSASGIIHIGPTMNTSLSSTIVAGNQNNNSIPDLNTTSAAFRSFGYNLIGSQSAGSGFVNNSILRDQVGTTSAPLNPRLDALAIYGGTTPTHRLQANSPAIDKGNSFGYTTDQRAQPRPVDYSSIPPAAGGDNSDIGAFEAGALPLVVTKIADTNDGACDADCSLREAIAAAAPSGDTIMFASPLFDSPQVITLNDAAGFRDLSINKNLTIVGKGANLLTVRRDPITAVSFRIFVISAANVNLSGMTISGGRSGGSIALGGGIFINANSNVTINACHVTGNEVVSSQGNQGGGIGSIGSSLLVSNSTVSNNRVITGSATGSAGGIYASGLETRIINSTVSGNTVTQTSGSTTSDNGGGIYVDGIATIINSTVTDNGVVGTNSASGVYGFNTITLGNTIVAGNRNDSAHPDVFADNSPFFSQGFNLIGSAPAGIGFIDGLNNDRVGSISSPLNPRLAPLGNYGGATSTHALFSNSPAVNGADPNSALVADQRGAVRNLGGRADIGAYELNFTFSNSPAGNGGQGTLQNGSIGIFYNVQFSTNRLNSFAIETSRENAIDNSPIEGTRERAIAGTFSVIAGSLPQGLTLDAASGNLSGTPMQGGTFNFIIKYTDTDEMAGAQAYALNILAPTPANVTISGQVLTPDKFGLRNALVTLTSQNGDSRTVLTGKFGSFSFTDVVAGETYILSVASKRYSYAPQVITVTEDVVGLNFVPQ